MHPLSANISRSIENVDKQFYTVVYYLLTKRHATVALNQAEFKYCVAVSVSAACCLFSPD